MKRLFVIIVSLFFLINIAMVKASERGVGIIPESQYRLLTDYDLAGFSAWELDIARNEIYARHGRPFSKAEYRNYFNSQSWYKENPDYQDSWLSDIEIANAVFIKEYQKKIDEGYKPDFKIGVGIIPASQYRLLTKSDLLGLSAWELNIARNEIYARHGRPFSKAEYRNYFNSQSWYEENPNYQDSWLSDIEKANAGFIKEYQDRRGLK